jgi:hydrogenase nickel incorporation protein HypA/HybF
MHEKAAMHEMSILESIIEVVEEEHRKQPFGRVRMIRIRLGALAAAEPDSLRFCFAIIAGGSIAEGAHLEIETVGGAGWCEECCSSVTLTERYGPCPACGGARLRMTAGDELQLAEIEVE